MNRKSVAPLVALALLLLVPALLALYPQQVRGTYVLLDYQLTRPVVLQVYFLLPITSFLGYSAYRAAKSMLARDESVSLEPTNG